VLFCVSLRLKNLLYVIRIGGGGQRLPLQGKEIWPQRIAKYAKNFDLKSGPVVSLWSLCLLRLNSSSYKTKRRPVGRRLRVVDLNLISCRRG
jgi:hypothetical protein